MDTILEQRKQKMYELIDQWRKSGLPQKVFCKQEKVSHHAFRYYVTKQNTEHPPESLLPKFMPITLEETNTLQELTITYPSGVSIKVANTASAEFLRTLIHLY